MVRINRRLGRDGFWSLFLFAIVVFCFGLEVLYARQTVVRELGRQEVTESRDANTRVWEVTKETESLNPDTGQVEVKQVKSRIIEKGAGICYRKPINTSDPNGTLPAVDDSWMVTDTSWRVTADGFVIDKAGYGLEIGKTAASIMKYFIDGRTLNVRPFKLVASDEYASADLALLNGASVGRVDSSSPNKLVFADAFGAGVDLEIEALPGGYHQNVIFSQKPILVKGMDPAKTKIHLFTEMDLDAFESSKAGNVSLRIGETAAESDPNIAASEVGVSSLISTQRTVDSIRFVADDSAGNQRISHYLGRSDIFAGNMCIATAAKEFIRDVSNGKTYLIETLDASVLENSAYPIVWDYSSVSGTLNANETWVSGETYYISSDITIGSGYTLTIEPGAVVKFADYQSLIGENDSSSGILIAEGTALKPVAFTSEDDDSIGEDIDGIPSTPGSGWEDGIIVGDSGEFEYCNVYYVGLKVSGTPADPVQNNKFNHSPYPVTIFFDASDSVVFSNNLVIGGSEGLNIYYPELTNSSVTVKNCTFDGATMGISIYYINDGDISIKDNLFTDCVTGIFKSEQDVAPLAVTADYNGFENCTTDTYNITATNSISLNSTVYSPEGTYYLDQNSGAVNAGSHSNGMPGFTTDAVGNEPDLEPVPDNGNGVNDSQIDLGYHYSCQNPYNSSVTWYVDASNGNNGNAGDISYPLATIQYAIDLASYRQDGGATDTIIIKNGTYYENIRFRGVDIEVKSQSGYPDDVTVEGDGYFPTVSFTGSETSGCKLTGITITSSQSDQDIVAHWKLDDSSTEDSTTNGHDGTINGTPVWQDEGGHIGGALQFDGDSDDYVEVDYSADLNPGAFTVALWAKVTGDHNLFRTPVCSRDYASSIATGFNIYASGDNNNWQFWTGTGGTNYTNTQGPAIVYDQWTHIVGTFEPDGPAVGGIYTGTRSLYVNGTLADQTVSALYKPNSTNKLYIGRPDWNDLGGQDGRFHGLIDDVRVYDRALDAFEIERMFACNPILPESEWTFDGESDDSTVYDSAGGNNNGTLKPEYDTDCPIYVPGVEGEALYFDGNNDYVDLGNKFNDITLPCSVTAWINVNTYDSGVCIFKSHDTHSARYGFSLQLADLGQGNLLSVNYCDGTSYGRRTKGSIDGNGVHITFPSNEWVFVAGVIRGPTDMDLYANGQEMAGVYSGSGGDMAVTTGAIATIGSNMDSDGSTLFFEGMIDDVRVYDRALSGAEIWRMYGVKGGGINGNMSGLSTGTEATISKCVITGNTAEKGGGIYDCDGLIEDCVISDNMAVYGAGMYFYDPNTPVDSNSFWSFDNDFWSTADPNEVADDAGNSLLTMAGNRDYKLYEQMYYNWDIVTGYEDQCVKLIKSDCYLQGDPVVDRCQPFSVFVRAKIDYITTSGYGLISQADSDPNLGDVATGYNWLTLTDDGHLQTGLFTPWPANDPNYNSVDPNLVVDLNDVDGDGIQDSSIDFSQWHQYGLVWDGTKRHLYFDGQLVASDNNDTADMIDTLETVDSSTGLMRIGIKKQRPASITNNRYIDNLDFYDQAMSDYLVEKLYNFYIPGEKPKINRCKFINNGTMEGTDFGGGIYSESGYLGIANSLFFGNNAYFGGGIDISDGWLVMVNCTLSDNSASDPNGGGIYSCNTMSYLLNSILWGNEANGVEADLDAQFYADADSIAQVIYSCVQDDSPGGTVPFSATNIDKDPNFIAPASGDYRLEGGTSPSFAIDAGNKILMYPYLDIRPVDLDGTKRVQNDTVDMGCYENGGLTPHDQIDTVIMCWIDESDDYHRGNYYTSDLADLQTALEASSEKISIGIYAPVPHEEGISIFPHSLGVCGLSVLYDYPDGIDIVKQGLSRDWSRNEVFEHAKEEFESLIGDSFPTKVILVKDMSRSTPRNYVGIPEDKDNCGVNDFAEYLDNHPDYNLDIEPGEIEVIGMNSGLYERWLYDIANEIE